MFGIGCDKRDLIIIGVVSVLIFPIPVRHQHEHDPQLMGGSPFLLSGIRANVERGQ